MASKEMRQFLDGQRGMRKKGESGSIEEQRALTDEAMSGQSIPEGVLIDDAFHVFQIFTHLPESRDARSEIGEFYNRHI